MNEDDDDENKEEDENNVNKLTFEQAIRCYSEAVKMDPEDVSLATHGRVEHKASDVVLARIAFESGLLVQPTHALL